MDRIFESECLHCGGRVTGNGTSRPWRHDVAPQGEDKHQAHATGTLREI